jgi:hypothetical protein
MALNPVSFEYKNDPTQYGTKLGFIAQELLEVVPEVVNTHSRTIDEETGEAIIEKSNHYGVFYDDLIPVLTKAIQEQQGIISKQNETINDLKSAVEDLLDLNEGLNSKLEEGLLKIHDFEQDLQTCCFNSENSEMSSGNSSEIQKAELGQNIPNPFSESTVIQYYLPDNTTRAIIRVTDMEGRPVEDIQLGAERGANQVSFQTQGLSSGTYLYSLFVNGEFISTKKMVIAK